MSRRHGRYNDFATSILAKVGKKGGSNKRLMKRGIGNWELGIGNRIKFHVEKEDEKQVSFS